MTLIKKKRIDTITEEEKEEDDEELGVVPIQIPIDKQFCIQRDEEEGIDVTPNPAQFKAEDCSKCTFRSICGSMYNVFKQIKETKKEVKEINQKLDTIDQIPETTD